jgi:hypothetical protein
MAKQIISLPQIIVHDIMITSHGPWISHPLTSTNSIAFSASLAWVRLGSNFTFDVLSNTNTGHCGGGVGAHMIGQTGVETTTLDPQNNVLVRMVDWVENGNAPETVTGTKYVNASPRDPIYARFH